MRSCNDCSLSPVCVMRRELEKLITRYGYIFVTFEKKHRNFISGFKLVYSVATSCRYFQANAAHQDSREFLLELSNDEITMLKRGTYSVTVVERILKLIAQDENEGSTDGKM